MKKSILLMLAVCCCAGVAGADNFEQVLKSRFENREASSARGDNDVFVYGNHIEWRNGSTRCSKGSIMGEDDVVEQIGFQLDDVEDWDRSKHYYEVKMVNNTPRVVNRKGITVKHEVVGDWDLIVFRNRQGAVVDVAIGCEPGRIDDEMMLDQMAMLDGVYASERGDTAVFGPDMVLERYSACPGNYRVSDYYEGNKVPAKDGTLVFFAERRMKEVSMPRISQRYDESTGVMHYFANDKEISKDEYDFIASRPAGYGGHGALLGPIVWKVKTTATGLAVELMQPYDKDQDWRYSPFDQDKFNLKWVRSIYPGLKGRWAVASVRPLTRGMLQGLSKTTLRAIVKGIDARHTRNKTYSAIEKLNKSLINTILTQK